MITGKKLAKRNMSKQALIWQKMKSANEREDYFLNMKLRQIRKEHAENLQLLHKEKCDTTAELRSYCYRKLRNDARKKLYADRKDIMVGKGSMVEVMCDSDNDMPSTGIESDHEDVEGIEQNKSVDQKLQPSRVNGCSYHSPSYGGGGLPASKPSTVRQRKVVSNDSQISCVIYQPNEFQDRNPRHKKYGTLLPPLLAGDSTIKIVDCAGRILNVGSLPSKQVPSCVQQLRHIHPDHFDPYTDGAMALAVRRFRQIQRESMPPLSGHLPVRKRYNFDYNANFHFLNIRERLKSLIHQEENDASSNIQIQNPVPLYMISQRRIELLKQSAASRKDSSRQEIKQNNEKLDKLKKAKQAIQYKDTLTRADSYMGISSKGITLVHQEHLSPEEIVMLKSISNEKNMIRESNRGEGL